MDTTVSSKFYLHVPCTCNDAILIIIIVLTILAACNTCHVCRPLCVLAWAIYAQWARRLSWDIGNANQSNMISSSSSISSTGIEVEGWLDSIRVFSGALWATGFGRFDQLEVGKQKHLLKTAHFANNSETGSLFTFKLSQGSPF